LSVVKSDEISSSAATGKKMRIY